MGIGIDLASVSAYLIALVVLFLFGFILFKLFKVPLKILSMLIVNSVAGGCILFVLNYVFQLFNFTIPVNIFTAVTVGILGIPGIIMLGILRFIL